MGTSWVLPLSVLRFLLQSRPGVPEPGPFCIKPKQQMCSRSKSHALQLLMRFQSTGQTKTSVSGLPSLKPVEPCVPPWSGRSVCASSTFFSAFKLPSRGGVSLKTHWGWTQILLWFHAVGYLLGTWGFASGSQKCPDKSPARCYCLLLLAKKFASLTPSQDNCLILTGSESKNTENCRDNKAVPSSSFWFSCNMKLKSVVLVPKSILQNKQKKA